jgi:site-specific recombinase XerD
MDNLKYEILRSLENKFTTDQLRTISDILDLHMNNYDIKQKETEVAVINNRLFSIIDSYIVCKKIKGFTKSSLKQYRRTLLHFAHNMTKDINNITSNDIRLYLLAYEEARNVSKSVIDDKRRILNSFYSWAIKEEIITKNPMLKIDVIKCDKRIHEPLTDFELEQLRNECKTDRDLAIIEMLYSTGCRVSELISLNKKDIDYTNAKVKVYGKGKKERWCFLNAKSQLALKKYIFSRTDNNEALFVSNKLPNNRLGKGSIEKQIKHLGKMANIREKVTPHTLRRSTATHLLAHGASLEEVQAILGHERSETTLLYAKLDISNLQLTHKRCVI